MWTVLGSAARPILRASVLAFPGEGADDALAGNQHARLLGSRDDELVAVHLEVARLTAPGIDLVPGEIDVGGDLVAVDGELARIGQHRLEQRCPFGIVGGGLAIGPGDHGGPVPVRRDDEPAVRLGAERLARLFADVLHLVTRQLPGAGKLLRILGASRSGVEEKAARRKSQRKKAYHSVLREGVVAR